MWRHEIYISKIHVFRKIEMLRMAGEEVVFYLSTSQSTVDAVYCQLHTVSFTLLCHNPNAPWMFPSSPYAQDLALKVYACFLAPRKIATWLQWKINIMLHPLFLTSFDNYIHCIYASRNLPDPGTGRLSDCEDRVPFDTPKKIGTPTDSDPWKCIMGWSLWVFETTQCLMDVKS